MLWQHFSHHWPFVRGIHRPPVNSHPKSQWRGALMLSLISAWTNGWEINRDADDLRRHRGNYDVTCMTLDLASHLFLTGGEMHRFFVECCSRLWADVSQHLLITTCETWWRHQKTLSQYWPFVRGIDRSPVDSHTKGPVMQRFDF